MTTKKSSRKKKIAVPWQARQGDVLVERTDREVTSAHKPVEREHGGVVLAHGEVTGHAHQIREPGVCELRAEIGGLHERILRVESPCALVHEEHATIPLGAGSYEIVKQVEYDPFEEMARAVAD